MTTSSEAPDAPAPDRSVLLVLHGGRPEAVTLAREVVGKLAAAGVGCRVPADERDLLAGEPVVAVAPGPRASRGCELVVVLGGDGTILRGAEYAHADGTPLLAINLGHVGFLAEAEPDDLDVVVAAIAARRYVVEERLALDVVAMAGADELWRTWALNEASVEKESRERMIEVVVGVDGQPLSRWGTDGVVCATPSGSTAYAWSAGGPVVWPELDALVVVPISAHALFARPLVVAATAVVAIEVLPTFGGAVVWCDGRRSFELPEGARVEVRRHRDPVRFARLHPVSFTERLVAKFSLPVQGWRGGRT
ncbi:MAG: NAD kinase [Actinomycetota bacterium]|nr:MAG: NAD kinase [Actinomycetota bacterium]